MTRIHLITSCTDRKRGRVPDDLRVRSLADGDVARRTVEWVGRLSVSEVSRTPANDVYVGEHWSVVRRLLTGVSRCSVVSAGYGLIDVTTPIAPYAATFQTGHPDSVAPGHREATAWWQGVNEWSGPSGYRPCVAPDDVDITVVALSSGYLQVLRSEISTLDPEHLLLISGGGSDKELPHHRLPVGGALRLALGGSLMSLNVRVAEHLIRRLGTSLSRATAAAELERLAAEVGELPRFDRRRLDDQQVLMMIARWREQSPSISATAAHRRLRSSGYACEQGRFRELFKLHVRPGEIA